MRFRVQSHPDRAARRFGIDVLSALENPDFAALLQGGGNTADRGHQTPPLRWIFGQSPRDFGGTDGFLRASSRAKPPERLRDCLGPGHRGHAALSLEALTAS